MFKKNKQMLLDVAFEKEKKNWQRKSYKLMKKNLLWDTSYFF